MDYDRSWHMFYMKWWIQKAMGYYMLWVITVWVITGLTVQSALVIRTTFVPLCFCEQNVLIISESYECSYNQRNHLVFWKFVLTTHVLITRVLITRVDFSLISMKIKSFDLEKM